MTNNQFTAIMPFISSDLIQYICKKQNISETEALNMLYSSKLYSVLEQEDTKLWHYSTEMLYQLLEQELQNGNIVFPDV